MGKMPMYHLLNLDNIVKNYSLYVMINGVCFWLIKFWLILHVINNRFDPIDYYVLSSEQWF